MSVKKCEQLMDKWYEAIYKKLKESNNLLQISDEFSQLCNDEERVSFSWKLECVQETLNVREMYCEKNGARSVQVRTAGNKEFQRRNFLESLKLYNESVRLAPVASLELAMAVANRSAVLFHMKKFPECLQDITLALANGYPAALQYKIFERQGKCHYLLHQPTKALQSFNKTAEVLSMATALSAEKLNSFSKNVDSWVKKSKDNSKHSAAAVVNGVVESSCATPELTNGPNSVFPCLSAKLDVTYTTQQGRYITAAEDVQVGEILAVEKPFASVLLPEYYLTHCLRCLKRVLAPVPCRQCAKVCFCSEQCENVAWSYHQYECKFLDFLVACDIGKFGYLALRVITRATWNQLKIFDYPTTSCDTSPPPPPQSDEQPFTYGNSYLEIYNLVAHSEERSTSDLFRRSIMSVLLVKCLQYTDFFGANISTDNREVLCVGGHLLRMLQVLPCNAHEISEFVQLDKDLVTSHTIEIAAAIYATFSLFNHSCDPSVTRNFYGDACVMRAIQTVATGDEVADNYGYVSAVTAFKDRKSELRKQYYFECGCGACVGAWPLYAELESNVPTLKCGRCGELVPREVYDHTVYHCLHCGHVMNVQTRLSEVYDASACLKVGIDKMIEGDDQAALPQLLACIERLDHCVERPWQDINSCQQGIIQCYNVLQSNRHVTTRRK